MIQVNQFGKGLAELLTEPEELIAAKVRRHPHTPTYSSERVCVMGDAAQAMSPMPRAGAGQGLEDALVLSTLLAQPNLRKIDVPAALEAYTRLRQPRRSMIAERASQLSIVSLANELRQVWMLRSWQLRQKVSGTLLSLGLTST